MTQLARLLLCLLLTTGCAAPTAQSSSRSDDAIRRAAAFLWSQQGDDGGWHSQTYGLLRSGQSLTPFVLNALLQVPPDIFPMDKGRVNAALDFIVRHTDANGAVGRIDSTVEDYPNYATALAVQAIARARREGWQNRIAPMIAWLRRQQFTEEIGWTRDHPAFGAWGMGGRLRTPPDAGQVDLSMTRYVLEAFAAASIKADDPAVKRAEIFLRRCQNDDGGFLFSPVVREANKAGGDGNRINSYATATGDGILALLAMGVSPGDARVVGAGKWLRENHLPDRAGGFAANDPREIWSKSLRYYCAAASTKAFRQLNMSEPFPGLFASIARDQRADGSWVNPFPLQKEDDPLVAATLALMALTASVGE